MGARTSEKAAHHSGRGAAASRRFPASGPRGARRGIRAPGSRRRPHSTSAPAYARMVEPIGRDVVIAGVNKAGTTSLFVSLSEHPDIAPSAVKETRFFLPARYGRPLESAADYDELFPSD